jgi:protein-disulfide isomerase
MALTRRGVLAASATALSTAGCLGTTGGGGEQLPPPVAGDPEADVTVAVYEDFACPHCRTFNERIVPAIEADYIDPGIVRYEHHDFPIPVHPQHSWQAASAARSVQHRDGDFWTFSKGLFASQSRLGPPLYESLANQVDVNGSGVRTDAVNERFRATVDGDRQRGRDRGVSGTPTVFVDGEEVSASTAAISDAIEAAR